MRISDWSSDVCSSDLRHAGTAGRREFHHLPEVGHRQDARHDRHGDAGRTGAVEEAEIDIGVEEILGDAARGDGIDLALEMLEFDARRASVRLAFRVAADAHLAIADLLLAGDPAHGLASSRGIVCWYLDNSGHG